MRVFTKSLHQIRDKKCENHFASSEFCCNQSIGDGRIGGLTGVDGLFVRLGGRAASPSGDGDGTDI